MDNLVINKLASTDLLGLDDLGALKDVQREIVETLDSMQMFRTRTEMEISILNDTKFPTPASKYWQALREQGVMAQELIQLSFEYRKKVVEIKILEKKYEEEQDDLEQELLKIEIEKEKYMLSNQERQAGARLREILDWSKIKSREMAKMTSVETEHAEQHQLISYTKRWIQQSILMGNNGSPAERQNLLGQLRSGLSACIEFGLLDTVLEGFDPKIKQQITTEYGVS